MTARGKTIALGVALILAFIVLRVVAPTLSEWIIVVCVGWSMCSLASYLIRRFDAKARR